MVRFIAKALPIATIVIAAAFLIVSAVTSVIAEVGCTGGGSGNDVSIFSQSYGANPSFSNPNPGYDFYFGYDLTFYYNGTAVWAQSDSDLGGSPLSGADWSIGVEPPSGVAWSSWSGSATVYNNSGGAAGSVTTSGAC